MTQCDIRRMFRVMGYEVLARLFMGVEVWSRKAQKPCYMQVQSDTILFPKLDKQTFTSMLSHLTAEVFCRCCRNPTKCTHLGIVKCSKQGYQGISHALSLLHRPLIHQAPLCGKENQRTDVLPPFPSPLSCSLVSSSSMLRDLGGKEEQTITPVNQNGQKPEQNTIGK